MTSDLLKDLQLTPMVDEFPRPGTLLRHAYRELNKYEDGTDAQKKALGDPSKLARPWLPSSLTSAEQRTELWSWLEDVVTWLNHDYAFDPSDLIPACWPQHRHLVHELAVLADQRYAAETATRSDLLEDWHRYALPAFLERMRHRIAQACSKNHTTWPSRSRYSEHVGDEATNQRRRTYIADARHRSTQDQPDEKPPAGLHLVDIDTGELSD